MSQTEIKNEEEIESFEQYFSQIARQVSEKHNFDELIKEKKEAEKLRMIKEIQERLSLITGPDAMMQPFINSHLSLESRLRSFGNQMNGNSLLLARS